MTLVVKLVLPDALHARPANLLVRLASLQDATIEIRHGDCKADARHILDVLALGAAKGAEIELHISGVRADAAAAALRELVERNFDADLVPERGIPGVPGIAIGRAVVREDESLLQAAEALSAGEGATGEPVRADAEHARAREAFARVERDVIDLVGALPPAEAELFEPEIAIVRELLERVLARIDAGERAEVAVRAATEIATTDLLHDARARLLDALSGARALGVVWPEEGKSGADGARSILVTDTLTPSLVAFLPPHVAGIVVGVDEDDAAAREGRGTGFTSHAAILARGRDLPLAYVPSHVTAAIVDGDVVVIDTTESKARVWVSPSDELVAGARARQVVRATERAKRDARAAAPLAHLGLAVRANIGSLRETIPAGADGIGLLRTELVFAGRTDAPGEAEQYATVCAIAQAAKGAPIVARLFDAGGDKPLAWLPELGDAKGARGIALLRRHGAVLAQQVAALCRAREHADIRILLPLAESADDVANVRALCTGAVPIGAMIETPTAVAAVTAIAASADFLCIGTNDLTAFVLGVDRATAALSLEPKVMALVRTTIDGGHALGKTVTVCGEIAGDPRGARILVGLGVDAISVAPGRLADVKLALQSATLEECRAEAKALAG